MLSRVVEDTIVVPWGDGPLLEATLAGLGVTLATQTHRKLLSTSSRLHVTNPAGHALGVEIRDSSARAFADLAIDREAAPAAGGTTYRVPGKPASGWTIRVTIESVRTLL